MLSYEVYSELGSTARRLWDHSPDAPSFPLVVSKAYLSPAGARLACRRPL